MVEAALLEASETGFVAIPDASGGTAAVFISCGMGDGFYPIRIGRDTTDAVAMVMVMVMVDLELLNHSTGRVGPPGRND